MTPNTPDTTPGHLSSLRAASPLIFMFPTALLLLVGMLVWLAATPTWFVAIATAIAMLAMTAWVLVAVQRLLATDA